MRVQPMVHFGSRLLQVTGIPYSAPGMSDAVKRTIIDLKGGVPYDVYELEAQKASSRFADAGMRDLVAASRDNATRFFVVTGHGDRSWEEIYNQTSGKGDRKTRDAELALIRETTPPSRDSRAVSITVTGPGEPRYSGLRDSWSLPKTLVLDKASEQTLLDLTI